MCITKEWQCEPSTSRTDDKISDVELPSTHGQNSAGELTPEELSALPARVRDYIAQLQQELSSLRLDKARVDHQLKEVIRKRNWSKARY